MEHRTVPHTRDTILDFTVIIDWAENTVHVANALAYLPRVPMTKKGFETLTIAQLVEWQRTFGFTVFSSSSTLQQIS